jgi:hypothetical protein
LATFRGQSFIVTSFSRPTLHFARDRAGRGRWFIDLYAATLSRMMPDALMHAMREALATFFTATQD